MADYIPIGAFMKVLILSFNSLSSSLKLTVYLSSTVPVRAVFRNRGGPVSPSLLSQMVNLLKSTNSISYLLLS